MRTTITDVARDMIELRDYAYWLEGSGDGPAQLVYDNYLAARAEVIARLRDLVGER